MRVILLYAFLMIAATRSASADIVSYYVGIDNRSTPFNVPVVDGGGVYADNPNQNHLTLLFHHGNHYHGIGTYNYTGPAATPILNDTNANNRVPEISTALPPITLRPGAGAWAATFRSGLGGGPDQDLEYGNFELRSVHSLAVEDPTTYNSSSGRWNASFDSAHIHLQLVSKTAGLNIGFGGTPSNDLANSGDDYHLGDGDELFSLLPTFWVADSAAIGSTYSAEFRLVDENEGFGQSGRFFIDFQVVPEPTSAVLALASALGLGIFRRRVLRTPT